MSRRGFACADNSSDQARITRLHGQIAKLKAELSQLKSLNAMNLERMSQAYSLVEKMREELEAYKARVEQLFQGLSGLSRYEFLFKHVANLGRPFDQQNIPLYLLMARCGEGLWNLFVEHLGFPCWRTIQRWRSGAFEEYGISRELLNGEIPNLERLFRMYFGDCYEAKRVILAVDAAGVSPRIIVHKNGQIDGFINEDASVTEEEASVLRNSLQSLREFAREHHTDIVKDFFVVFVCPLESFRGGFPILLYPKGNGVADPQFISRVLQLIDNVRRCDIDVVGLSCDGDHGYLRFVTEMANSMDTIDVTRPLHQQQVDTLMIFEDLLHLAKCVRYRFVCGSRLCPYPHENVTVSVQDFERIGVFPWVLDNSQVRKMDDFLPIMFFNVDNFTRGLDLGMPQVSLCVLPMTLMLSAVMNSELTRQQRLDYLSRAWAFFWCYKQAYRNSLPQIPRHKTRKLKGENQFMALYDFNTLDKALSLCYSLSRVIADGRAVHLGALGTHWLEHFFGNVRRLCNKNDSPANFERSLLLLMLNKAMFHEEQQPINRKRLSDSGAILYNEENDVLPSMPLGSFIFEAAMILRFYPHRFNEQVARLLLEAAQCPKRNVEPQFAMRTMVVHQDVQQECGSTRSSRMTDTAGLCTRRRNIMSSQL